MPTHLPLHPRLLLASQKPYAPGIGESGWLRTATLPGGKAEVLLQPFYVHRGGIHIVIPAGFVTDGASIPWPLRPLMSPNGPFRIPAVVHDWLYYSHRFKKRTRADAYLSHLALDLNAPPFRTMIVDAFIRAFGWIPWNRYRKGDAAQKHIHPHLDTQEF